MGLGGVISDAVSIVAKLLRSSSSSPLVESHQIEVGLKKLMESQEWIKATLSDADKREIRDEQVKLWLKELKEVADGVEDVLDLYHYQVLEAQVQARDAPLPNPNPQIKIQVPDDMLDQIREIRSRFAEIEKHRMALQLFEEDGPRCCNSDLQTVPTGHFVIESNIIGRHEEKEELIDELSSEHNDSDISVVAIVGTGGIGKTTLAQLVYNDQRIQERFDKFGWVCISEDFNVQRLIREVFESITGKSCALVNLSALQKKVTEEVRGKRLFLVVDDVWNENRSHWELFLEPFMSASLVKILVTTRIRTVSDIMQPVRTMNLSYMSKEENWQLFQHYAFGGDIQNADLNLVEIAKEILTRCGHLPLAVKSIASLLRQEKKEESWRGILGSELWESDAYKEIFRPLYISYARLPKYLKCCFLYCSMFPKKHTISIEELVKLWIYQGYVKSNGLKNAENIGREYVQQLWQRSLIESDYKEKEFHLHDIVHDLARSISGHGCYSIEGDMVQNFPKELCHLYVCHRVKLVDPPPSPSKKSNALRTLILKNRQAKIILSVFNFSEAQKLRALHLSSRDVDLESHISFVNLKHLRYLSLNNGHFNRLPECICSLYNLQNLTLNECPHLTELPKSVGNLVSLEELTLNRCGNLRVLPVSLCQLKTFRKLRLCGCDELEELPPNMGNLVSLVDLTIQRCGHLRVLPASLCQLKALRELLLSNCPELKELPHDMGNLVTLEELTIIRCNHLSMLPLSLCQLKALRKLHLRGCPQLKELPPNMENLTSLKEVMISGCDNLDMSPLFHFKLQTLQKVHISWNRRQ